MTSVISSAYLESPNDFDMFVEINYRPHELMLSSDTTNCLVSEDRLLSGRPWVRFPSGAPTYARALLEKQTSICNSEAQ